MTIVYCNNFLDNLLICYYDRTTLITFYLNAAPFLVEKKEYKGQEDDYKYKRSCNSLLLVWNLIPNQRNVVLCFTFMFYSSYKNESELETAGKILKVMAAAA